TARPGPTRQRALLAHHAARARRSPLPRFAASGRIASDPPARLNVHYLLRTCPEPIKTCECCELTMQFCESLLARQAHSAILLKRKADSDSSRLAGKLHLGRKRRLEVGSARLSC